MLSNQKINVIYNLRTAVEAKVRAEQRLAQAPSQDARLALLNATIDVEEKTQSAIDVCHECGRPHAPEAKHHGHVIEVDFGI
jgi:hypothetical protein